MKLTPIGKLFIALVILGVIGYVGWTKYSNEIKCWASPEKCQKGAPGAVAAGGGTAVPGKLAGAEGVSKDDFANLGNAPKDPDKTGFPAIQKSAVTGGRLRRPLRVG